ncbi:hypothetical protein D9M69_604550 [compost metagenome]
MVEAGFTDRSALTRVWAPGPVSGRVTRDSELAGILLAVSAFCTLAGRLVLTWAACRGRAQGRIRAASARVRMDLSIKACPPGEGG